MRREVAQPGRSPVRDRGPRTRIPFPTTRREPRRTAENRPVVDTPKPTAATGTATETGEFYSAPVGASPFEPRSVQCNRGRVAQELLPSSSRTRLGADARRVPGVTMDDGLPSGPVATGRVPR